MATEIDKRVVEMQFDNRDFEKNCQASLSTLEKLKMALNFDGAKGLDSMAKAANKIDLSGLSKGAEAIEVKFNAMSVAGMTAISELTKGFLNLGKTIWNVSFGQMKSGGMARTLKIEQANFQMKALAKNIKGVGDSAEKVDEIVEKMVSAASNAVQGTAYGLDAASAVAAQLMASGLTNAEEMENHLKGIAGAAAMTGRSYEDIGNIFTTVASNGRLMTMQLRQFSAAGLNLSATLAQSLGKTEEQINEMVTKGQISFEQFSKALSDAFGESAQKADDTFTGVTTNVKAQLSRIGQIFTDPYVKHMVPFLKEVKAAIKRLNTVLQPLGKTWDIAFGHMSERAGKALKDLEIPRLKSIVYGVENIFVSLFMILDTVRKAFAELFPPKAVNELNTAASDFEKFTRQLIPTQETLDGLKQILITIMSPLRMIFNIVVSLWKNGVKPLFLVVTKFLGALLKLGNALKPFNDKLKASLTSFQLWDSVLKIVAATLAVIINWLAEFITAIAGLLDQLAKSQAMQKFADTLEAIGKLITSVIVAALVILYTVISKLLSLLDLNEMANMANRLFKIMEVGFAFIEQCIITILNIIQGLANSSNVLKDLWEAAKNVFGVFKDFLNGEDPSNRIDNFRKSLNQFVEDFKKDADVVVNKLKEIGVGKILLIAFALGIIFLVWSLKKFVDYSSNFVKTVNNIASSFTTLKRTLSIVAQYNGVFQILLGIAVVLAAFTSALSTVASIPAEDLKRSAIVIGIFGAAIMGFAIALLFLQNKLNVGKGGKNEALFGILVYLTALAGAILLLTISLKILSGIEMDFKQMITPFLALIGLMFSLVGATVIMSQLSKDLKHGALTLLGYAASIKILVSALDQMTKLDINKVKACMIEFLELLLIMGASVGLAGIAGAGASGLSFLGAALSLLLVIAILKKIAEQPIDEIKESLKKMALLFAPILIFLAGAGIATGIAKTNLLKETANMLKALLLIVAGFAIVAAAFGKMDPSQLKQGLISLGIITLLVKTLIDSFIVPLDELASKITGVKVLTTGTPFKYLTFIIIGLVGLISALGFFVKTMGDPQAIKGVVPSMMILGLVFGSLFAIMGLIMKKSESTKNAKVGPILALVIGFLSIISAMSVLATFMDADMITKFAMVGAVITLVMLAFSLVLDAYSGLSNSQLYAFTPIKVRRSVEQVLAISFSIIAIMGAMGGLIYAVAKWAPSSDELYKLIAPLGALAAVIIAMGIFVGIATGIKEEARFASNAKSMCTMFLGIAAVIAAIGLAIAGILYVSKDVPFEQTALTLVGITAAVGIIFWVFSKIIEEASDVDGDALAKASLSFLTAAGAFIIIGTALTLIMHSLKGFNGEWILAVAIAFSVPFAALIAGMIILTKLSQKINYETFADEMKAMGKGLLSGSLAFVAIAGALAIIATVAKNLNPSDIGKAIGIFVVMTGMYVVLVASMVAFILICNAFTTNAKDIERIAYSILIASTSFLVIAGALALISYAASKAGKVKQLESYLGTLIGAAIVLIVGMGAIIALTRNNLSSARQLIAVGASLVIASTSFMIIAGAMAMVANVVKDQDIEGISQALGVLVLCVIGLGIIITAMIAVSAKASAVNIMAIAVSFLAATASILIMVEALKEICSITSYISVGELLTIAGILVAMTALFAAMAGIGAILGTLGMPAVIGILALCGSFTLFSAGVFLLAEAGKIFIDTIEQINDAHLDADAIAVNTTNAIKGIAQAIYNCKDEILFAVGAIILGIMAILASQQVAMALQAVAWVTAFIAGLAACMPVILPAIDSIMQQIIDYESKGEGSGKWEDFGKSLGRIVLDAFIGVFKGIAQAIAETIVNAWESIKDAPLFEGSPITWGEAIQMATGAVAGPMAVAGVLGKKNKDAREAKKVKNKNYEAESDAISEIRTTARVGFLFKDIEDSRTEAEKWADVIDLINKTIIEADKAGYTLSEDWNEMIEDLKIPDEYIKYISKEYNYDKEELLKALTMTEQDVQSCTVNLDQLYSSGPADQNIKTLTRDSEEAADAVSDIGTSAEKSSDSVGDISEAASKAFNDVKSIFADKSITSSITDNLKGVFGDFDVKNLDVKSLLNLGGDVGSIIGGAASEEIEKDAKATIQYWADEAKRIVNPSMYQYSGGKSGFAWQDWTDEKGNKFGSFDEATQYKLDDYMNKTYGTNSVGRKSLLDYLGLSDLVEDSNAGIEESILGISDAMDGLGNSSDKSKSKFKDFVTNLHDSIKSGLDIFAEISEQEEISSEEMLDRMWENTRRVGQWATQIAQLAARGMSEGLLNELKDLGPQGAAKVDAFARMTQDQLMEANRLYADAAVMPDQATKTIVQSYANAGYNASLGFSEGVNVNAGDAAMQVLAQNALNSLEKELEIESPSKKTMKDGEYATQGLAKGIIDPSSQMFIKAAAAKISDILLKALQNNLRPDKLKTIGTQFMQGFNNGLDAPMSMIVAKVTAFASRILSVFGRILQIHSPSKAMEQLGEYTMEGFGLGMETGADTVEKTTENTANDILEQMKANIAAITDGWTEDNAYQPVIRPVFDMDALNQGYTDIQTWFANSQGLNLNGNISRLTPTTKEEPNNNQQLIDAIKSIDNDKVVNELVALRSDISELQSAMTNLQVVMNTGALVGQILEPMDVALGAKAMRNQRGR